MGPRVNTIGELKELIKDLPDDALLLTIVDFLDGPVDESVVWKGPRLQKLWFKDGVCIDDPRDRRRRTAKLALTFSR